MRCRRINKVTNLEWLLYSILASVLLLSYFLIRTIPQQSRQFDVTLETYESQVLPLQSSMVFARRTVEIQGNMNATQLYWSPGACPPLEDYEKEEIHEPIVGFYQGKIQKEIMLLKNSICKLTLDHANGPIEVNVFANWDDERNFERGKQRDRHAMTVIKSDTVDVNRPVEFEFVAETSGSHVFLYQSRRGQSAEATYHLTRRRYNVETLHPMSDTDLYCTYQRCVLIQNSAGCLVFQSMLTSRELPLHIQVGIKHYPLCMILVSFIPLFLGLVLIKWNGKPIVNPSPNDQFHASRVLAGYELVNGEMD